MSTPKHIVLIAGEESGDAHAASLVRELKEHNPSMQFSGIGGKHMQDVGVTLTSDLAKYGVTGISEVFRHLKVIRKAYKDITKHLEATKPDLLILIDYPGFNLRLARYVKEHFDIKILFYISPQIWAWKAKRIHTIKKTVDMMAVILPFEKKIYEEAGVPVRFVGHPLVDKINQLQTPENFLEQYGIDPNKKIIVMMPGSRTHEVEQHMPTLIQTMHKLNQTFSDLHFIIPVARTLDYAFVTSFNPQEDDRVSFIDGHALEAVSCATIVLSASGTASLECALLAKPMAIFYSATYITYVAASQLIKVRYIGLCNLLANQLIVPEFLQYDFNADSLTQWATNMLHSEQNQQQMILALTNLKNQLSSSHSDCSLRQLVEQNIF